MEIQITKAIELYITNELNEDWVIGLEVGDKIRCVEDPQLIERKHNEEIVRVYHAKVVEALEGGEKCKVQLDRNDLLLIDSSISDSHRQRKINEARRKMYFKAGLGGNLNRYVKKRRVDCPS